MSCLSVGLESWCAGLWPAFPWEWHVPWKAHPEPGFQSVKTHGAEPLPKTRLQLAFPTRNTNEKINLYLEAISIRDSFSGNKTN
jgi:hypothetical protein